MVPPSLPSILLKQLVRSILSPLGFSLVRKGEIDSGAHSDFSDDDHALCAQVKPFTMTSKERIYALYAAVRYVVGNRIPGAFVECGVWRGGSMMVMAQTLQALGDTSRDLHLFDTFEGMPPPGENDRRYDGVPAQRVLEASPKDLKNHNWAVAPLEDVRRNVVSTGYPESRVHFHQGLVERTIPGQAPGQIALLRLDTDWYESTKHELDHLYERVTPNGVIIFDDYGWWAGSKRAVDEFLATLPFKPLLQRIDRGGRLMIKPANPSP